MDAIRLFDVKIAKTPEQKDAAFRLRYQVYCVERGYEPGQGAKETDRFDPRSGHAILVQRSTGLVVGTVRVVAPKAQGDDADLPMQLLCARQVSPALAAGRTGEISRFAISKDLRDGGSGDVPLRLGLMRGIVEISAELGLTHWCAVMERTLLRLLRLSGIHFDPLGPAIEYRGLRQPSWGGIERVLDRMRRERPAVWDYVTDEGTLWKSVDAVAAA
ncbi:MAG: GNAT family N-acetyltransferase [Acidisphaera sp.]|nr:GNAT family N-acetyltransferase [Acidisphaera sp.]